MSTAHWFFAERVLVAMTFALSAATKARDLDAFHRTLRDFRLAGDRAARRLAPTVVALEAAVVVLVVASPGTAVAGNLLALALLAVFTAVLANARAHGSTVGCNCFGSSPQPLSWYDVARNVVLMIAIGSWLLGGGTASDIPAPATAASVVLACAAAVLLLVNLRNVGETLRRPILVDGQS
jgi:hypothetical protein